MAPDPDRFRQVIGHFPTGVSVVTCGSPGGPVGLTTNAVASLSLDPVLLLVCFDRASRTLPAVRAARRFALNVLAADQEDLARAFASKRTPAEKFEAATHRVAHGVPVLDGAVGWLACDLRDLHDGGDHVIGVGAVTACADDPSREPLVFHDGAYRTLEPGGPRPSRQPAAPGTR
jgi:flavin reductase (DIM6/NTAB) family NADH-FMN oxidoreductase RutF